MSNPDFEPRGCPTPGACSAAGLLEQYKTRIHRADHIILLLTADHNTGKNYVKGFDMAQEYFQDFPHD